MESNESRVVDRIVKGLTQDPAYLLMFAVCLLVFGIGATTGVGGIITSSGPAQWGGLVIAAFAIAVTAVVIVKLESIGSHLPAGAVGEKELERIFAAIHENIRGALRVQHPIFHDWIKKECSIFRSDTRQWAHGEIKNGGRRYNELLVEIYARAEKTIFATATEDYFSVWKGQIGRSIVGAHRKGKASVERVFIFDSLDLITAEHLRHMREQADPDVKVKVYVYGIKEHESYEIPKLIGTNFAYVDDGDVIVATDPSAGESQKGTFYFKDDNQRFTYEEVISNLRDGCKSLDEFIDEQAKKAASAGIADAKSV